MRLWTKKTILAVAVLRFLVFEASILECRFGHDFRLGVGMAGHGKAGKVLEGRCGSDFGLGIGMAAGE